MTILVISKRPVNLFSRTLAGWLTYCGNEVPRSKLRSILAILTTVTPAQAGVQTKRVNWISTPRLRGDRLHSHEWTESIAVGSVPFVETVKALLGFRAKGREVIEGGEGFQLREEATDYKALFEAEKSDIGPENAYYWDLKTE